jgi:hypothetical protein
MKESMKKRGFTPLALRISKASTAPITDIWC